ncbi:MAG: membrane protein insertase YidC [Flavobacteriaceae bacterium]|nr:membrane protein insertase YidC [Flavobacteriaceae bacterium]
MEEKKFDLNSLIGFVLLGAIMLWYFYTNQPTPEELAKQKTEQVQDSIQKAQEIVNQNNKTEDTVQDIVVNPSDSLAFIDTQNKLGAFAYSASLPSAKQHETIIENELVKIKVSNKGGQVTEVLMKKYDTYNKLPLYIIKDNNASFNLSFATLDNRNLQTKDLFFEPTLTKSGDNQVLSMKLKVSPHKYLEYRYELKPDDYMLDFAIRTQGLGNTINTSQNINLDWEMKSFRTEKSIKYENQYTDLRYLHDGGEFEYMSAMSDEDEDDSKKLEWVAFKQQFFTSILLTDKPFKSAKLISKNLVEDEFIDTVYTKQYYVSIPLQAENKELDYSMNMYYGPVDYAILSKYEGKQLDRVVSLGWGIFRWINKYVFVPVFAFLSSFIGNFGIVIILMTIVVRIIMSPMVYKSYLSSAKMKVLRPEMEEINKKLKGKDNAMKRQQETMALQRKAGVSPLSGCIPALIQMPVFFALFRFFPANIDIRHQGFLWADDLSAYDEVFKLPFNIPFYGDHVSLFPILASIAIFFYMQMTQSQQMNMQQPAQEGMPDMQKMMKMMLYLSPLMMLFFFNTYASSLSLYYFISNLLTIVIMLVIKNYIINEDKILAQIQENKKKPPKKKSAFRERLDSAMKQAQEQQAQQKKGKKS